MRMFLALAMSVVVVGGAHAQRRSGYDHPPTEESYRALIKAAEDPNRDVRARVAWVLGRIGEEKGAATLLELAADPTETVRVDAVRALRYTLPKGSRIRLVLDVETAGAPLRRAALLAAELFEFEQRESLVRDAWDNGPPHEKALAIRALSLNQTPGKAEMIEAALAGEHVAVQVEAIEVLGKEGSESAVGTVLGYADSDNFELRAAMCRAAAHAKAERALPVLRDACGDTHYLVRRDAIRALVALGSTVSVPAIQARIDEQDYTVRVAACEALGEMVTPTSPPYLARRVSDEIIEVRDAAQAALMKYPADMAYRDVMQYGGTEHKADTRVRIWSILGEYGHPDTADYAFEHLEDDNRMVQGYAMRIMRKQGDRRSIPHIKKTLTLENTQVASEVDVEESFRAAGMFEMKEFTGLAKRLLALILNPPEEFYPSDGMLIGCFVYLAAVDHQQAVPLMEELYEAGAGDEQMVIMAEALNKLTGKTYELPVRRTPVGRYFIDVIY